MDIVNNYIYYRDNSDERIIGLLDDNIRLIDVENNLWIGKTQLLCYFKLNPRPSITPTVKNQQYTKDDFSEVSLDLDFGGLGLKVIHCVFHINNNLITSIVLTSTGWF